MGVGAIADSGTAIVVHPSLPVRNLGQLINYTVMAGEPFQRSLTASGLEPCPASTPEKTRRFVADEIVRWTPVIKAIGLKLD